MARPKSYIAVVCPNTECLFYNTSKGKNIIRKGKNSAGHQRYYCEHCNKYFVETTNTPFYHHKLTPQQIHDIFVELAYTRKVSSVERLLSIHRETIRHLLSLIKVTYASIPDDAKFESYLINHFGLTRSEARKFFEFIKQTS